MKILLPIKKLPETEGSCWEGDDDRLTSSTPNKSSAKSVEEGGARVDTNYQYKFCGSSWLKLQLWPVVGPHFS